MSAIVWRLSFQIVILYIGSFNLCANMDTPPYGICIFHILTCIAITVPLSNNAPYSEAVKPIDL